MSKLYEIAGGWAHRCDCCEKEDGRPTLYWEEKDFDLCYDCLTKLFIEHGNINQFKLKIKRKTIPEIIRNEIFERDGFKCKNCGSKEDLTIDHIKPFWRGGLTEKSNLQTLCRKCNSRKGVFIEGEKKKDGKSPN